MIGQLNITDIISMFFRVFKHTQYLIKILSINQELFYNYFMKIMDIELIVLMIFLIDSFKLCDWDQNEFKSYNFLHHKLVRSINALACRDLHRFLCNFLSTEFRVSHESPGGTLSIQTSTSNSNNIFNLQDISSSIELNYEPFVDDDKSGLKMTQLLASSPLFGVGNTTFEGLLRILRHNMLQTLDQVKRVGQRPCKTTVNSLLHFSYLSCVNFDLGAAEGNLSIANDHSFSFSFECEDGGVVPLLCGEGSFQKSRKHLNYYISMIIPINRSLSVKSSVSEHVEKEKEIINGHGVHDTTQLILVGLLIIASVTVVFTTNEQINQHDRYLRTYFNLNLLGKDDLGLYQQGLNIDESQMQFATLGEMKQHFGKILNVSNSIAEDGLVAFVGRNDSIIKFEMHTQENQFNITHFDTVQDALSYFHYLETDFFRDLLLSSYQLRLTLHLGENKFLKDYQLIAQYKMYSELMIKAKLDVKYQLKKEKKVKLNGLRIFEQIIAAILFLIYLYQVILLSQKNSKHRILNQSVKNTEQLRKKFRNWYLFLQLMCLIILFSRKYAPICAFFQILPIFEFPERQQQKQNNQLYNFNKNLRFSFPLIMTIFFQIFIFLNGFIFYSMLMYPGEYFDDYLKGFFSYIYQLFQVGTYQIFTELQSYGNFAYLLYALLYFYVFQVGNSLIPALFVIMIEMKVTQKFLKRHVTEIINDCVCPKCNEKNSHQAGSTNMHIIVKSPKLSPLLNRKKFNTQNQFKSQKSEELMMLYIEEEEEDYSPKHQGKKYHQNYKFANYSKKILHICRRLQNQTCKSTDKIWLEDCLKKVQARMQRID